MDLTRISQLSQKELRNLCKSLGIKNYGRKTYQEITKEIKLHNAQVQTHTKEIEKYEKTFNQNAFDKIGFVHESFANIRKIATKMGINGSNKMNKEKLLSEIKNSNKLESLLYKHYELKRLLKENKTTQTKTETNKIAKHLTKEKRERYKTLLSELKLEEELNPHNKYVGKAREMKIEIEALEKQAKKTIRKNNWVNRKIKKLTPADYKFFNLEKKLILEKKKDELKENFRVWKNSMYLRHLEKTGKHLPNDFYETKFKKYLKETLEKLEKSTTIKAKIERQYEDEQREKISDKVHFGMLKDIGMSAIDPDERQLLNFYDY